MNCCFKQSVFSACPRQTSGRLVLMFTNRTRWQSLKRASPESLTPACVSAGTHTDSIHLLTYYLHYDCSQWSVVFYLLCWFCHFALVKQWLTHTGRSVYVFALLNINQVIISCLSFCSVLFVLFNMNTGDALLFFLWHVNRIVWACIYLAPVKIYMLGMCIKWLEICNICKSPDLISVFVHWQFWWSSAWSECHEAAVLPERRRPSHFCRGGSRRHLLLLLQGFQTADWCVLKEDF